MSGWTRLVRILVCLAAALMAGLSIYLSTQAVHVITGTINLPIAAASVASFNFTTNNHEYIKAYPITPNTWTAGQTAYVTLDTTSRIPGQIKTVSQTNPWLPIVAIWVVVPICVGLAL